MCQRFIGLNTCEGQWREKAGKPSTECRSDTYEGETAGRRVRLQCKVRPFQPGQWRFKPKAPIKGGPVSHSTRPVLVLLPFFVTGWGQPTRSWRDAACQQLGLSVHYATYIRRSERHILPATTLKHQWWTGHVSFRHLKKLVFKWEEMDQKQKCLNGNNKWVLLCK